jgi:predicted translin family RNA/ssDNA-binding protein
LKSIIVVKDHNYDKAREYFADLGFKFVRGSRYLGGFIGEAAAQQTWVEKQCQKWSDRVGELSKVAERYPQAAYAGMMKSLQQEWQFLQRVTD